MNSSDGREICRGHGTASFEEDERNRMSARPAWTPPIPRPQPGDDPYERFKGLLGRLLKVPKSEIDEQREREDDSETKKKRKP